MSDESSRKERSVGTSSSSVPSVQASGGSRPQSSLTPSESTGSSGNSVHNSLARPNSSSSVSEQAHHEQASTSSSKRESPTLSSSPPSDSLVPPPRPKIRPDIKSTSSRLPSYPWLPGPPARFGYHPRSHNLILPLIPPYSRCRSDSSSQVSHSSGLDSKYPSALHMPDLGIIQFDALADDDEEMGNSKDKGVQIGSFHVSWRGVSNMLSLLALVSAILALFLIYPVVLHYRYGLIDSAIASNLHINATGQAQDAMTSLTPRNHQQLPLTTDNANHEDIDPATPPAAFMKWGKSGAEYDLAFSDEQVTRGRATTRCVDHGFVEVGFVKDKERRLAYWRGEWTVIDRTEEDLSPFFDRLPPKDESLWVTLEGDGILSPDPDRSRDGQMSIDYIRIYELRTRHGHTRPLW
ncbi:hypothetical protein JOM56_009336 [Amanita muscaria]